MNKAYDPFLIVYYSLLLAGLARQVLAMYKRYRRSSSTEKVISLLGKKNTGKTTPKEDSELGYSDFTLTLTFHLPHPQ